MLQEEEEEEECPVIKYILKAQQLISFSVELPQKYFHLKLFTAIRGLLFLEKELLSVVFPFNFLKMGFSNAVSTTNQSNSINLHCIDGEAVISEKLNQNYLRG